MSNSPPDEQDPFNTKRPTVYRLKGLQLILFYPAAWLLWAYFKTLRVRFSPGSLENLNRTAPPRILAAWHNRSLAVPLIRPYVDPPRIACLISPSRMAAWEAAFFDFLDFKVVRGSTTRRSIQASMELLRCLRGGNDIGITPDGPSGPLYSFSQGAVAMAKQAGVPFLFLGFNCRFSIRLNTWDRHMVPLPFSHVEIRVAVISPEDPVWRLEADSLAKHLRRVCLEQTLDPSTMENHEHE